MKRFLCALLSFLMFLNLSSAVSFAAENAGNISECICFDDMPDNYIPEK